MVYSGESVEKPNGTVLVNGYGEEETKMQEDVTLLTVLKRLTGAVFAPDSGSKESSLQKRIKAAVSANIPLLRPALKNSGDRVLAWARRGSPLRALLAVSVGTICLITSTGLLVFMLIFVTATVNAVIISLVMSLAAAAGFLALFITFVAAIYIGALSIAVFVISTITAFSIGLVLIATGWIGFFFTLWLAAKKSIDLAKLSVFMTGSALSAYSFAQHHSETKKI